MKTTTQISMASEHDPDEFVDVDVDVKFTCARDPDTRGIVCDVDAITVCETREELDVDTYMDDVRDACIEAWADAQHEDPDDVRDRMREERGAA